MGDHVIDCGANFGAYTKELCQLVGKRGKVLSIEPVPETYAILKNNLYRARMHQAIAFHGAASDNVGYAKMVIPHYENGVENFYSASLDSHLNGRSIEIHTSTLDVLVSAYALKPSFIKLDVEGHEPSVLRGAMHTIQTFRPVWLIEVNDGFDAGSKGEEVRLWMENQGYRMYYFNGERLIRFDGRAEGVNFVFIHNERTA
jgi:FkbM family methyltransferase